MKKIIYIVIGVVLVGGFLLLNKKEKVQTESIKIGAVLSLSGDAAQDGENIQKGIELAKTDLEKKGVIVEIIYQDDKTQPKDTVSAINALAIQKVEALIGPTWSYLADAGLPVAERLGLAAVMPANTSEYVSAKGSFYFFTSPRVERIEPVLTEWLKKNNKKKVAIISNQGAWYDTVTNAVVESAKNAGSEISFIERIPFGSEVDTMPTIIAKVKNINADLIFAEIDDTQGLVVMLKKMQEQNISQPIMSVTTSIGRVVRDGQVNINKISELYIVSPESSKEFQDKFMNKYGEMPGAYSDRAYDSLMLVVDAIKNKKSTPLNIYLREKTNYKGYVGQYKFDANGDITGGNWVINKIK